MQRTAQIMEESRRFQETAARTAAMMDELSSMQIVGKSKAGASGGRGLGGDGRRGGVTATCDGQQRPLGVEVDPKYLFSSTSDSPGILSVEELNAAISDAVAHAHGQSRAAMEEKMKVLYAQLGMPREPPLNSGKDNTKK